MLLNIFGVFSDHLFLVPGLAEPEDVIMVSARPSVSPFHNVIHANLPFVNPSSVPPVINLNLLFFDLFHTEHFSPAVFSYYNYCGDGKTPRKSENRYFLLLILWQVNKQ